MPARKTVKSGSSSDILLQFNKFKETINHLDKTKQKQTKSKKQVKNVEKKEPEESSLDVISIVITADLKKKAERELKRLAQSKADLVEEDTLNSEDEIVSKDPKVISKNVLDLEEIITSKKDYSSSEEESSDEEEEFIDCDNCDKKIKRDSEEHDNMICDVNGDLWFCLDCLKEPRLLMENHDCILTGHEDEFEKEDTDKENTDKETEFESEKESSSEDEVEIDTETVILKNGIEVQLNLQNNMLYVENDEEEYEIYGKVKETKGKKFDFICQYVKYELI